MGPLLAVLVHVNEQIRFLDGVLERLALQDKQVERLRTVPSVGPVLSRGIRRYGRHGKSFQESASA